MLILEEKGNTMYYPAKYYNHATNLAKFKRLLKRLLKLQSSKDY
jgi:hypothetical protein